MTKYTEVQIGDTITVERPVSTATPGWIERYVGAVHEVDAATRTGTLITRSKRVEEKLNPSNGTDLTQGLRMPVKFSFDQVTALTPAGMTSFFHANPLPNQEG